MLAPQAQSPAAAPPSSISAGSEKASDQNGTKAGQEHSEQWYPFALSERIRDFFGREHSPDVIGQEPPCGLPGQNLIDYRKPFRDLKLHHWCVPDPEWKNVRFVIATFPDPVHTHLGLFFDRSIDAIGQGASSQGYTFDRAIMPWHYFDDPKSKETEDQAKLRESFPGLMIFRSEAIPPKPPLFVLVVAETPTSGINKEQFHHALEMIHDIRQGAEPSIPPTAPEFGILGPTFSGSLYSLRFILKPYLTDLKNGSAYSGGRTLPIYATVMGTPSIKSFQAQMPNQVRMSIFEEDAAAILTALCGFVSDGLHYEESDIAVLNEDETSYGGSYAKLPPKGEDASGLPKSCVVSGLSFPRGISQFRSAYSKEFQSNSAQNDSASGNQQVQRNLRLDLSVTGSDDDSVAPYAPAQTALSQEGVMLAILSELRLHQPKFILLTATDPLDKLFLARYLRDNYPQGRLVIPSPDLLFPRDEGGQLDGVLGLNTYPLSPSAMNTDLARWCNSSGTDVAPPIFPASFSAALYNAASMLIFRLDEPALQKQAEIFRSNSVPGKSDSPCSMSPDLYLTIVNRNSIRPIKILQTVTASTNFASSDIHLPNQTPQRNTRMPPTWYCSFLVCLILFYRHLRRSWTGGILGEWQTRTQFVPPGQPLGHKAWILWLGGIILIGMFSVLASANTPVAVLTSTSTPVTGGPTYQPSVLSTFVMWFFLVIFASFTCWDFWMRRGEHLLCGLFLIFSLLVPTAGICFALHGGMEMVLWQQRVLDITSGVSSATPMLVLLLGLYGWFWYSLRGASLVDWRCPQLPERTELPDDRYNALADSVECIRHAIGPFSTAWWKLDVASLIAVSFLALTSFFGPTHVPIRSLEGLSFDVPYSFLLGLALVVLVATLLRLIALWLEFRRLLTGLDRAGLKDALRRLNGFEWKIIWNPAWSVQKEGYKLVAREIQTIERLGESLAPPADPKTDPVRPLKECIKEILDLRHKMIKISQGSEECPTSLPSATRLMVPFEQIQRKFAETAGLLCKLFLDRSWQHLPAESDTTSSGDEKAKSSCTEINIGTAVIKVGTAGEADPPPVDASGLSHISLRLAEEFVARVYSNFLVTVLLRVRGLVFSAVALYVCIVFSTISYPFQPAPELKTLAIALFLFAGGAIGYVYEEMHRDPTLSRMTSTDPGKLDSSFWVKFATAGIAPLVALASTVYPPFGHLLYTLVGPLLQALR